MTAEQKAKKLIKMFGKTLATECVKEIILAEEQMGKFLESRSKFDIDTKGYWNDVKKQINA